MSLWSLEEDDGEHKKPLMSVLLSDNSKYKGFEYNCSAIEWSWYCLL